MRALYLLIVVGWISSSLAAASAPRFVIDDDEYVEKVSRAGAQLLKAGKLVPLTRLQAQVHPKSFPLEFPAVSQTRLAAPDLYDRLRESVFAVGIYYKCSECPDWHVNSSSGFVVREDGILCTCCHVVSAKDDGIKEAYMIAADSTGRVFPVEQVVAADPEADTCFLKISATGLKPLPFRTNARAGERVYCLSHPGGYHFMFTAGMVARVNRRRDEVPETSGGESNRLTRPILFLNVTAEFAPGSSGAPLVDEECNVLGQVSSIADAGDPAAGDEHTAPSPSVPVRFCVAAEEIIRLGTTNPHHAARHGQEKPPAALNKKAVSKD